MKKAISNWLKANRSIAIQCLVAFGLSVAVTNLAIRPKGGVSLPTEGYDFNSRKGEFSGPAIRDAHRRRSKSSRSRS